MKIIKFTSKTGKAPDGHTSSVLKDTISLETVNEVLPEELKIAIGTFDGVHTGHRRLIKNTVGDGHQSSLSSSQADFSHAADGNAALNTPSYTENGRLKSKVTAKSAVLTFSGIRKYDNIMTEEDKLLTIGSLGANYAVIFDFNSIKGITPREFVSSKIWLPECSEVHCGYNFRFGKDAAGDTELLRQLLRERNTSLSVLPPVKMLGGAVSSTRIRQLLKEGRISEANLLLGDVYSLNLPVYSGYRLGRTLGFPTANQRLSPELLCPRLGVYAARVNIGAHSYPAVCNVGRRPTVSDKDEISVESHIIGYSGDLYGKRLRVMFYEFLRDEIKFTSKEELAAQILRDKKRTEEYFLKNISKA